MKQICYESFADIPASLLYEILKLRQDVFIIEQQSIYEDIDRLDQSSHHILFLEGDQLAAYSRILPAGMKYEEASVGRIIVAPGFRGKGIGRELVRQSVSHLRKTYSGAIRIEAQAHLQEFYREFQFRPEGNVYDMDGIPHIQMVAPPVNQPD
jgi:ElaA protein